MPVVTTSRQGPQIIEQRRWHQRYVLALLPLQHRTGCHNRALAECGTTCKFSLNQLARDQANIALAGETLGGKDN